ncbi:hypothetical protein BK004_00815 [bacterium CG10_46_32]|nr:MAG: hypothetical protein BK004_00815 [bacterium CG10_46_32]PIR56436.1 MAG: hypothetical protein COU73_00825 [Parcubacteria group bacterium CG10_big_fil_rev_8_21_14_0_10_46_32]
MKKIFIVAVVGLVLSGAFFLQKSLSPAAPRVAGIDAPMHAVVHKSPTCGCCANYITYLKRQGFDVEVQNHDDLSSIKEQYGVPGGLESCHTTVIGDYVSEGHVPAENIIAMLTQKPVIAGIALPGMPAGSPGMGGAMKGAFSLYSFSENGDVSPYKE